MFLLRGNRGQKLNCFSGAGHSRKHDKKMMDCREKWVATHKTIRKVMKAKENEKRVRQRVGEVARCTPQECEVSDTRDKRAMSNGSPRAVRRSCRQSTGIDMAVALRPLDISLQIALLSWNYLCK